MPAVRLTCRFHEGAILETTASLYARGFRNWYRSIGLAIGDEWRKRSSRNIFGLGVFLILLEPLMMIAALVIFRVWLRDRLPRFGLSAAVFYASGILPFYLFQRISIRGRATKYEAAQRLPRVTSTDHVVAQICLDISLYMAALVFCLTAMWLYGLEEAKPWSLVDCALPLMLLAALGIGVGLANSAVTYFVPLWGWIWSYISRMLIFASGVFYVADLMQLRLRNIIVWNPIVHGIDWFRVGIYGSYPDVIMDKNYFITWSLATLLFGIIAHAGSLRRTSWVK
jgi:capsular polysaccharide transport system permease protein